MTAIFQSVPPLLRFDIRLPAIIEVDFIFSGSFAPLFEIRAENPYLEGSGANIDGKNISLHIISSF
jgi:hypothetical protein